MGPSVDRWNYYNKCDRRPLDKVKPHWRLDGLCAGAPGQALRRSELVEMDGGRSALARKAWSVATTWAPSPTAAATRFTEPDRTSPIANTPGTVVSNGRLEPSSSLPVNTKPFGS